MTLSRHFRLNCGYVHVFARFSAPGMKGEPDWVFIAVIFSLTGDKVQFPSYVSLLCLSFKKETQIYFSPFVFKVCRALKTNSFQQGQWNRRGMRLKQTFGSCSHNPPSCAPLLFCVTSSADVPHPTDPFNAGRPSPTTDVSTNPLTYHPNDMTPQTDKKYPPVPGTLLLCCLLTYHPASPTCVSLMCATLWKPPASDPIDANLQDAWPHGTESTIELYWNGAESQARKNQQKRVAATC